MAIAALLLLSVIWAWASLRADLLPSSVVRESVSPLMMEALLLAIFAVAAAILALIRRSRWLRGRLLGLSLLVGIGLFAVPAVLDEVGKGWVDDSTRVALFSLTPLFAIVLEPHIGSASMAEIRGGFAAALLAVAGTLLVFPFDVPGSMASGFAFAGVIVAAISVAAANCLGVRLVSFEAPKSLAGFAAVASMAGAVCVAAAGVILGNRHGTAEKFGGWAAPDVIALALLFWLMSRMSAVRMSTRFLIAPLLANLIGLAFLLPHVQMQAWIGLVLIGAGAGWLLFAREGEPVETRSPLGIR